MTGAHEERGLLRLALPALPVAKQADTGQLSVVPAFPEIGAEWPGVCLHYIHFVGINWRSMARDREADDWWKDYSITCAHEMLHWELAKAFLPMAMRVHMLDAWIVIKRCANGELLEKLRVPVLPDLDGNDLARAFANLASIHRDSEPVEEALATSLSLYLGEQRNVISREEREEIGDQYKHLYADIDDFVELYEGFKTFIIGNGYLAAIDLAFKSLHTHSPSEACQAFFSTTGPGEYDFPNWSYRPTPHFREYYDNVLDRIGRYVDLDGAAGLTARRLLVDPLAMPTVYPITEEAWDSRYITDIQPALDQFEIWPPKPQQLNLYDPWDPVVRFRRESLRQQVACGVGLQCPFWSARCPEKCCGTAWPEFRDELEGLLDNTIGSSAWRPRGCLLMARPTGPAISEVDPMRPTSDFLLCGP